MVVLWPDVFMAAINAAQIVLLTWLTMKERERTIYSREHPQNREAPP